MEQLNGAKADTGRRYRAYPTPQQAGRLTAWGHCCRAVWNLALAQRDHLYRQRGYTLRAVEQCAELTRARSELAWLADLPAQSAQQVLRQLDRAFDNWWNPHHPAGPPTFKKRRNRLVVPFPGQAIKVHTLNRRWAQVRLPKAGWVRFRLSRPLSGTVRNATVSHDGLGWHVSFGVATGTEPAAPNGLPGCGVDFGLLRLGLRRGLAAAAAAHPHWRRTAAAGRAGAPQGPPGPLGQTAQPRPVLSQAAPHHRSDRRAQGATGA